MALILDLFAWLVTAINSVGSFLAAVQAVALFVFLVVFFRSRTEVSITINDFRRDGGRRVLHIRNFGETSLIDAVGKRFWWARRVWAAAKAQFADRERVLVLPAAIAKGVLGAVRGQVSTAIGCEYVSQALADEADEQPLVAALVVSPRNEKLGFWSSRLFGPSRLSIQCITTAHLREVHDRREDSDALVPAQTTTIHRDRLDAIAELAHSYFADGEGPGAANDRPAFVEVLVPYDSGR